MKKHIQVTISLAVATIVALAALVTYRAHAQSGSSLTLTLPYADLAPAPKAAGDILCGSSALSWTDCPPAGAPNQTNIPLANLAAPKANGDQVCAVGGVWSDCSGGMSQRSVATGTDTIAPTDIGNVVTYSGTAAVAVTLGTPASLGQHPQFSVEVSCTGAPTFTVPAGVTINGAGSLTAPVNTIGTIYSGDNATWRAVFVPAYLWSCH